ncbi:hypothetical protein NSTCB13_05763 [Nostoc sp. DSM 114160]
MSPSKYSRLIHFLQEDLAISTASLAVALRHREQDPRPFGNDSLAIWFDYFRAIRTNLRLAGDGVGYTNFRLEILDFGLKVSTKCLLAESQTILFIPILDDTKLPKLVLFGVKDTVRLSSKQIILSRATWCHLGELRYATSTLPYVKVDI